MRLSESSCGTVAAWIVLVLVTSTSASADQKNQPYGIYRLGAGRKWVGTVGGVRLVSCGDEALKTLASPDALIIEYSQKIRDIVVNGERWKDIWLDQNVFARKRDTPGYLLTVGFSRKQGKAQGRLVFMRVDSNEKPVCLDALDLTGSYKRS